MADIETIKQHNKKMLKGQLGNYLKEAWYFDKWYEKIIIVASFFLGVIKFFEYMILLFG